MTPELCAALAAANAEITDPTKNAHANAGQYGYTYATLDQVLSHIRGPLAKNGLSVVQDIRNDDVTVFVVTYLIHASGDYLEFGPISWPAVSKMQDLGSVISYARRYAVLAALGIATAEDTDAAGIVSEPRGTVEVPARLSGPAARQYARDVSKPASPKQVGYAKKLMRAHGITEVQLVEEGYDIPTAGFEAMTSQALSKLIDELAARDGSKPILRGALAPQDDPWQGAPPIDPETGEVAS